jgi:site-specific DNA-methyltransferase (adenine-specific)
MGGWCLKQLIFGLTLDFETLVTPANYPLSMKTIRPFSKSSQYKIYAGDCIEVLSSLPEDSVDLIFADPPYNLSNGGTSVHAGKRVSVDKGDWDKSAGPKEDFEFHLAWIAACRRVLKKNGTIWISGTYHSIFACGYALQLLDFRILNDIAWFKPNAAPNLGCRMFTASHETLIWASKSKKSKHTFNYKLMKEGDFSSDFIKKPGKQMRSVWSMTTPAKAEKIFGKHPTQKPLTLLERVVLSSSNPGDLILDPFAGSATTGIAALKHGRQFIGIDSNEDYLRNLAVPRLKDISKPKSKK